MGLITDDRSQTYLRRRVSDRLVADILGLCKGILADGVVAETCSAALMEWLAGNPDAMSGFPAREIYLRLQRVLAEGRIDDRERAELSATLDDLTGERSYHRGRVSQSQPIPLDEPEPALEFCGREFVFAGNFCLSRSACEDAVISRGGSVQQDLRRTTNCVVVGTIASEAWATADWGRTILFATELKKAGVPIAIVREAHWLEAIGHGE